MTVADFARAINRTPATVRRLANAGELRVVWTVGGIRLFEPAEAERILEQRRAALEPADAGADDAAAPGSSPLPAVTPARAETAVASRLRRAGRAPHRG